MQKDGHGLGQRTGQLARLAELQAHLREFVPCRDAEFLEAGNGIAGGPARELAQVIRHLSKRHARIAGRVPGNGANLGPTHPELRGGFCRVQAEALQNLVGLNHTGQLKGRLLGKVGQFREAFLGQLRAFEQHAELDRVLLKLRVAGNHRRAQARDGSRRLGETGGQHLARSLRNALHHRAKQAGAGRSLVQTLAGLVELRVQLGEARPIFAHACGELLDANACPLGLSAIRSVLSINGGEFGAQNGEHPLLEFQRRGETGNLPLGRPCRFAESCE